jgi:hypothetical protein
MHFLRACGFLESISRYALMTYSRTLPGTLHLAHDDVMRRMITLIAEIATIFGTAVTIVTFFRDRAAPDSQGVASSPSPAAPPRGDSSPAPQHVIGNALDTAGNALAAVNSAVHGFGMTWSGPALVMWAIPLMLVIGMEAALGADRFSFGHLIWIPILCLVLWLWVFWPSLSSLSVTLVIVSAVITCCSVFFILISSE